MRAGPRWSQVSGSMGQPYTNECETRGTGEMGSLFKHIVGEQFSFKKFKILWHVPIETVWQDGVNLNDLRLTIFKSIQDCGKVFCSWK